MTNDKYEPQKNGKVALRPLSGRSNGKVSPLDYKPPDEETVSEDTKLEKAESPGAREGEKIDSSGIQGLLPRFMRIKFADKEVESLYRAYWTHSKQTSVVVIIVLSFLFDICSIINCAVNYHSRKLPNIIIMSVSALLDIILFILCKINVFSDGSTRLISFIMWVLFGAQIYVDMGLLNYPLAPMASVGWMLIYIYVTYVLLPASQLWCFVLSVVVCLIHTLIATIVPATSAYSGLFLIPNAVGANILLYICSIILGILSYFFADRTQRRTFLQTRASLSVNLDIEEGSEEQQELLLSVLPKHVADEMVKDMGNKMEMQFRKIYMNRHENVSILFADIVGFTALSSTVTAAQLVRILNDLFATFDKLAHKYHQLRIKILGDCYYCISGCPDPRSDHSVLCIHMGLAMVEAIREVREKTQSGVNMRVGIHTGAVLGGVLGQIRWQYDALGKAVTLANKMESGGLPGRVHISEETAKFLNGEFDLEPGEGEMREDAIKFAGIKTYLIRAVMKPYPQGTLDARNEHADEESEDDDEEEEDEESKDETQIKDMNARLYQALTNREKDTQIYEKMHPVTLHFRNAEKEREYSGGKQRSSGLGISACSVILLFCSLSQLFVLPKNLTSILTFVIGEVLLIVLSVISLATNFQKTFPGRLVKFADWMERTYWFRSIWAAIIILILASADVIDVFACDTTSNYSYNATFNSYLDPNSFFCQYPTYFISFAILVLVGITILMQIGFIVKTVLLTLIAALYCIINIVILPRLYDRYDSFIYTAVSSREGVIPAKYTVSGTLIAITLTLIYYSRILDRMSRQLFYQRHQAEEMRDQIKEMKTKNEDLVYNILPAFVAKDFIGAKMKDEELYSQQFEETGVMFAACPNFNDFYTEDAVNNNGLECFRFLNEIISDYDDLLKEPRFNKLMKIKTVGPTYMAASGNTPDHQVSPGATITERWQHLADLVEFALAMKDALDMLNQQSFNNFMLRIGINHGPIVAGVIGAKKPHYDIWGNTVNVASRMESTGQVGKIQVVEETMLILQHFGYKFEKRGLVKVKGKGELMTYYLVGKGDSPELPNKVSPF